VTNATSAPLHLPDDHPGRCDAAYLARREAIAEVARSYRRGEVIPDVTYTAEEDEVWRTVSAQLAQKHRTHACREYLRGAADLTLPSDRVPQLREVTERVEALTGFRIEPVPGLVPTRTFYGALADRRFLSTQYVRHHSVPFYTPEPDIVHEIVGHANGLASPVLADLYEAAGRASLRASSDEALELFSRIFWFTLEFGLAWEDGELRTYGAGLLSSFGEIDEYRNATIRRWGSDGPWAEMGRQSYDITAYQPVLFAARSFDQVVTDLTRFFDTFDEETYRSLVAEEPR
jgi:phenylalanine-4-hydroxylase